MSVTSFSLTFLFCLLNGAYCLVTLQDAVSVTVPADLPSGVPFYEIIAVDNATGLRTQEARFKITRTTVFGPTDATMGPEVFTLQHLTGKVYLHLVSDDILLDFANFTFSVEIQGSRAEDPVTQNLTVVVNVVDWDQSPCTLREELCFSTSELLYKTPESLLVGTTIGTVKPTFAQRLCPNIQYTYSLPDTGSLAVDERSGELYISQELDFESIQRFDMNLSCQMTTWENVNEEAFFSTDVTLLVKDVDDNAPYLQQSTSSLLEIDASLLSAGKALPQHLTILDKDSHEVNNISVMLDDPLSLFSVKEVIVFNYAIENEMLISAVVAPVEQFSFPEETYNFTAVFVDEGLITNEENKVVFHVVITNRTHSTSVHYRPPKDFQFAANISRNAGVFARVAQPLQAAINEGYQFHLESKRMRRIFSVTPKTGIIYVKSNTLLRTSSFDTVHLKLVWQHTEGQTENHCIVAVKVLNSGVSGDRCGETSGCATHDNEASCNSSCGKGSPDGLCKWRGHPDPEKIIQEYATCSPDFGTCPDGICDELEATDISLCPQDCTDHIVGEGFLSPSGKGIRSAAGPCSCDESGHCSCISRDHSPGNRTRLEAQNRLRGKDHNSPKGSVPTNLNKSSRVTKSTAADLKGVSEISSCGPKCLITVGLISISTVILVVSLIVLRYVRKSQDQHKYVGNRVPLSAVTSDYVDHGAGVSPGSEIQSDSAQDRSTPNSKWEFPRDRLVCQETLGEGEFGKVIKAQAWEIGGRPGYTTVAVKMIKEIQNTPEDNSVYLIFTVGSAERGECGTDSEQQDLISEFNLLKEVSHPNIIHLLGACTLKGGPLYVIVEYAELGSLRNYLRKLRRSQETSRSRIVCNPSYFEEDCQEMSSSGLQKELFSFAWQISKGMSYLADMKVVHRDLAARNILLMKNKIIKISDFGLSRDVYEGDTYLKTTKGRVPVKWMAIESLGDHIYTTKSDVWSFGIILWELITLGASPYPGIMSEGLYHLLKEGYRMPQPENCPKEFYQLMFTCWRAVPGERPSFKELVQKLERLLQDTVDYLPLSSEDARTNNKCSDATAETFCLSPMLPSPEESCRKDGFLSSGSSSFKRSKISKTCLHLPRIPDTNYESRRLLQTPSEESTSA